MQAAFTTYDPSTSRRYYFMAFGTCIYVELNVVEVPTGQPPAPKDYFFIRWPGNGSLTHHFDSERNSPKRQVILKHKEIEGHCSNAFIVELICGHTTSGYFYRSGKLLTSLDRVYMAYCPFCNV
jgi:hypothetical protein